MDRPSDSDDSDSSESSDEQSTIVTNKVVPKTCKRIDNIDRAANICKGKIKTLVDYVQPSFKVPDKKRKRTFKLERTKIENFDSKNIL